MPSIVPHLWFDTQAREAAEFYSTLFDQSRITYTTVMKDTPGGDAEIVQFELAGQPFESISSGPLFKLNPSISLMVNCETEKEVDRLWQALMEGGTEMMPLAEYPFNPKYGWVQDRYGVNWQLMLLPDQKGTPKIKPSLLFSGIANGKAEEAVKFYTQQLGHGSIGVVSHYAPGEAQSKQAKVNYVGFSLFGQPFVAMDHGADEEFTFNEAFSLILYCDTQQEIDDYWLKLSHVPEAEACGWAKDQFGVSWQIVPTVLGKYMTTGNEAQIRRVTEAFMEMKKFDIATLDKAFEG